MKKYVAEFIGTFAMIFCGTGAIIIDNETHNISNLGIAITFGLIVMVMINALGNISGAHFNPAVTIAFTIAKKFEKKELIPYIISQFLGAILASIILRLLFPEDTLLGATLPLNNEFQAFVLEFIITFILMFVIIRVAFGTKEQGMFTGISIGATVLLLALFAGPISGASMNPVRSLAPALISLHFQHLWIYLIAPVLGAISSVLVTNYLEKIKL